MASAAHAILVGTDFSRSAEHAVERGIQIAKASRAALHLLHASPRLPRALVKLVGGSDDDADRAALERVVAHARAAKVKAHGHHLEAAPSAALRAKARELSADLVIVGARGRTLPDTFVGSTAERIAAFGRVPVLLVRRRAHRAYRAVIIAADKDIDLRRAVAAAAVAAPGRAFSVLHAYEGPFELSLRLHGVNAAGIRSYRREVRREAHAALLERLEDAGVDRSALVLRHGDPRRVLKHAEEERGDVLFVLQRGRSEVAHVLVGSVTRSLIAHATSDVLIV
ncbi:MAG: universal stress protein [Labilithrix sp.]|nr:universal stress protein [Labilithrix sp.]